MLNIGNIDLTKEYKSTEDEVKALKSYLYQLVEELQYKTDLSDDVVSQASIIKVLKSDSDKIHSMSKEQLQAVITYIEGLKLQQITVGDIVADHATVDALDANYAHISNGVIDNASIGYADVNGLDANYAHINNGVIDNAQIGYADVNGLNANFAHVSNGVIDNASIDQAKVNNLDTHYAHVSNGVIDNAKIGYANVNGLDANFAHINNGVIDNAKIGYADVLDLDANYATIQELHSGYAEIDLANVNNAWIENGVVKDASIKDAQIIGVSANKLTAGTIDASNITVTNLNADNITTGTLNGKRIGNESITLDKLAEEVATKEYLDNVEKNLQGQIDGQIETFTGTVVPTLNNSPASEWKDAVTRKKHVGDIYYVVNAGNEADGYTYRFTEDKGTYSWTLIKDNQITKVLQEMLDVQGDISDIKQFDSQMSSWKTDTTEELSSLKTRTTTLETGMGDKVSTSVFNEMKQTVDENSATITSLSDTVSKKADGSTVSTLSNTVNTISQKTDANEAAISNLTSTVATKADGSTVETLSQTMNDVKQTVDENSATITSLSDTVSKKADGSTVDTLSETVNTVKQTTDSNKASIESLSKTVSDNETDIEKKYSDLSQDLSGFKVSVGSTYTKSSDFTSYKTSNDAAVKAAQDDASDAKSSASSAASSAQSAASSASSSATDAQNAKKAAEAIQTKADNGDFDGRGISSTVVTYQVGTSGTTAPTGEWKTAVQNTTAQGQYLWTRTVITYTDSTTSTSYAVAAHGTTGGKGDKGDAGTSVTVKSVAYAYQLSTSGTTVPTGTWSNTPVAPTTTQYAWTRTTTTYSDNTTAVTYAVGGKTGTNGTSVTVSSIKYSVSSTENQPADSTFTYTSVPTVAEGSWLWTLTTYSDGKKAYTKAKQGAKGETGAKGDKGDKGDKGTDGAAIVDVKPLYYLKNNTTAPSAPTTEVTSTSTSANVWTTAVPTYVSGYFYFTCIQTKLSSGTSPKWSTVVLDNSLMAAYSDIASIKTSYVTKTDWSAENGKIRGEVADVETTTKTYTDGKIEQEVKDRNAAITTKANEINLEVNKVEKRISRQEETITGTMTSGTYTWTGKSETIASTDLVDGLTINYFLPISVAGSAVSATYLRLSDNANVNTTGVVLNLTFSDGKTSGNIPVWYMGVGRLTSHYGYGSVIKMTYRKDVVVQNAYKATGWWVDAQYNSDTVDNRIVYFTGKTGAKGIWANSLIMEDANGTYQNICTASDGTVTSANRTVGTTKKANTNGFKVGSPIWYTTVTVAANTNITNTNAIFSSMGNVFDSRCAFNTTLTANNLTPYKNLYLVGTVGSDGLFYLDSTWWTQTPTAKDKVYILVGGVYDSSTSYNRITLYEKNPWYIYDGTRLVDYATAYTNAKITVTDNKITAEVEARNALGERVSTVEQTAEGLTSTVSKKVGADEIISKINQSPESITINANRVNIEGATIFSSGRLSTTSLNNAYDAKGAASTAEDNAKKAIPTKVSQLSNDSGYQNATQVNTTITGKGYQTATQVESAITGKGYQTASQVESAITGKGYQTASDVSTAISGKADKTDAVLEEHIIYISKASGTTSVSGTTTWVTATSDSQNTWTLKRPTYNSSYPVLFTAKQMKKVSGTVTCTTPIKDDTTTVIDGGHITTGTIDASKATITNINASNITSGTLSADRIAANALTIGKVNGLQSALDGKQASGNYATSAELTNEINARKAVYGTSATAAATQAKAATCSSFALYTGASVTVTFTYANTHATPTLNVNSTGAKTIRSYTGAALSAAEYQWAAGASITFVYDGTYWRMQDGGALQAKAAAASSASAASTSATNAATSASTATTKASEASTSATNAASSASTASTKASEASTSATNAASSASTASSKATAASTSATNAATSATNASTSATNASNSATAAANSAATALDTVTVKDTRNDNQNPQWYLTNYPRKRVQEFKTTTKIGLTGDTYCWLQTDVPWNDSTGGWPKQTVELGGKQYWRQGSSATAWTAWVDAYGTATNAAKTATNYLTTITGTTGISVHNSDDTSNFVNMNSDGVSIYKGGVKKASYGDNIVVGEESESHLMEDYHSLQLIDKEGQTYFHISDLRGKDGLAEMEELFIGDGSTKSFDLTLPANNNTYTVTVSDSSGGTVTKTTSKVSFASPPTKSADILVVYKTNSNMAKAYTLGTRDPLGSIGGYSIAEGYSVTASGKNSYAEGTMTIATGKNSHAEGYAAEAKGAFSHAEGYGTTASGDYSHAEGYATEAVGKNSHAQNILTYAQGQSQTAIGKYNAKQGTATSYADTDHAFIIGNGTSESARSNALAVEWQGNVRIKGDLYTGCNADSSGGTSLTSALNAKQATITGGATTITSSNLTASRALISNASGKVAVSSITSTQLGYLANTKGNIGEYKSASPSANVSLATGTAKSLCSLSLTAGVWVVDGKVRFPSNNAGARRCVINSTNNSSDQDINVPANSSQNTSLDDTKILSLSSTTKIYLTAWQSSGATLTLTAGDQILRAVRIA